MAKLEEFDIGITLEERILHHQKIAKSLSPHLRANYWRYKVWPSDPELCEFQTGLKLNQLEKRRRKYKKEVDKINQTKNRNAFYNGSEDDYPD